jgi:lipid-binding SYLF domain-containing protein
MGCACKIAGFLKQRTSLSHDYGFPIAIFFSNRLIRYEFSGGKMKRTLSAFVMVCALALALPASEKECNRVENAGTVAKEIMDIPDNIPQGVIDKADCVVVMPSVVKAAFVFGGSYGRGVMTCRSGPNFRGPWGAPTMMALEGGSFGFQIGVQATDFVLLLMNDRAASSILTSKVKLGGDASAAAGPVGRNASAESDITMRAEILSYSRARGLFAGVSLTGSTLRADNGANRGLYDKNISAEDIALNGKIAAPACAKVLLATLTQHSPKNMSGQ